MSRRGNVAMMFGVALVPLMVAVGVGLDYARVHGAVADDARRWMPPHWRSGSTTGSGSSQGRGAGEEILRANYQGDMSNGAQAKHRCHDLQASSQDSVTITVSTSTSAHDAAQDNRPRMMLQVSGHQHDRLGSDQIVGVAGAG